MSTQKCPICDKPLVADYRPFCSRRCSDVDLQRWLSARHAMPDADYDEYESPPRYED